MPFLGVRVAQTELDIDPRLAKDPFEEIGCRVYDIRLEACLIVDRNPQISCGSRKSGAQKGDGKFHAPSVSTRAACPNTAAHTSG